jgi:hypothetical protein
MSKKHIFVSQNSFDLGRGRFKRRLEAKLDNLKIKSNENVESSHICIYKLSCPDNIPKYFMKCVINPNDCSIKKWYDRWGNGYLNLGIGD